jgi:hypothetical protein
MKSFDRTDGGDAPICGHEPGFPGLSCQVACCQAKQHCRSLNMQNHPQEPTSGSADGPGYANGPASVRAVSSRATSLASTVPMRWKISRACRRRPGPERPGGGQGAAAQVGQRAHLVPGAADGAGQVQGLSVAPSARGVVTADPVQRPPFVKRPNLAARGGRGRGRCPAHAPGPGRGRAIQPLDGPEQVSGPGCADRVVAASAGRPSTRSV